MTMALNPIHPLARRWWSLLLTLSLFPTRLEAETQDYSLLLPPTSLYIHYADGFLVGPGSIDLSSLTFTAVSEAFINVDDDAMDADDNLNFINDDTGNRQLQQRQQRPWSATAMTEARRLDGGVEVDASYVDIVAFHQPDDCASKRGGCDWTQLGVGGRIGGATSVNGLRWCCTQEASDAGLCGSSQSRQWQRLILNQTLFDGVARSITVPREGTMSKKLRSGMLELEETGRYVIVFANCNEDGRAIMVSGNAYWKSKHGYLPGQLFQFMNFYNLLLAAYIALFAWFAMLMKKNADSRIDIEKYILVTILLGLVEVTLRFIDFHIWNGQGSRAGSLAYLGIILNSMKHGISRALIVMVSLGWGVIRDTLGSTIHKIIILSVVYVAVACARDLMILYVARDMQTISIDTEVTLFDAATILTFLVAAVDVAFILWILDALNGTMQYLENMNQTRKLGRYLKLRTIFLFAILFATIMAVFSLVDSYNEDGIVRDAHEWITAAAAELNYFFVLCGVAILWKPNPSAKEYAYVMELPSSGDGTTELELAGSVPSAMSDDEDDPASSYQEQDESYKIDRAVAT